MLFRRKAFLIGVILSTFVLFLAACSAGNRGPAVQASLDESAGRNQPVDLSGFARVTQPRPFSFPADFGPHPEYQTEWWYYTGNLETSERRHFGYQLTIFRRALLPLEDIPSRSSDWASIQVYMAHFALTDTGKKEHHAFERLSRGAAGLAGATAVPYNVWLQDWSVEETAPGAYHLQAAQDSLVLDLELEDLKGPVLQGDQGFSRKGRDPGQASYYFSQTRLASSGTVTVGSQEFQVSGFSWMDHEYSTSYLSRDQVGWDWFALQLDDNHEVMLFQLRGTDGSVDPYSSGNWIKPDGTSQTLAREDFSIEVLDTWKSPHSGAVYPSRWRVSLPLAQLELEVKPVIADQELNVSYSYWEGAVSVSGTLAGAPVEGRGYVELTGYAGSMGGDF